MIDKQKSFVYEYWSRTELGRAMIASDNVSDDDLLFLIPNNVKRMHGLPVTRTHGKRKSVIKRDRKNRILSFKLFDLIEEIIEKTLPKTYNDGWFGEFVDFKNVNIGDKCCFQPNFRFDTTIPMNAPIVRFNNTL